MFLFFPPLYTNENWGLGQLKQFAQGHIARNVEPEQKLRCILNLYTVVAFIWQLLENKHIHNSGLTTLYRDHEKPQVNFFMIYTSVL